MQLPMNTTSTSLLRRSIAAPVDIGARSPSVEPVDAGPRDFGPEPDLGPSPLDDSIAAGTDTLALIRELDIQPDASEAEGEAPDAEDARENGDERHGKA